jgi:hypothetical protein
MATMHFPIFLIIVHSVKNYEVLPVISDFIILLFLQSYI